MIPSNTSYVLSCRSPCMTPVITYVTLHLPWTKTTSTEGADISVTECSHSIMALRAFS
ncbi:hypothetical protein BDR04DRAFT_784107 [Suillus decipiens]|nr:hypothetical protein BDR04DRAFT_784107 [Suillus decipiens]